MRLSSFVLTTILIVMSLLTATSQRLPNGANAAPVSTQHFEKDGLSFDYPDGWKLTDNSTPDLLYVTLSWDAKPAQIIVIVQRHIDLSCQFKENGQRVSDSLIAQFATRARAGALPRSAVRAHIGQADVEGVQVSGFVNGQSITDDVYWLRLNLHLCNVSYLRINDDGGGRSGWEMVRKSLSAAPPVIEGSSLKNYSGGKATLNGRAILLPKPDYPLIARGVHAAGAVVVDVVINENGDVDSARAVSGHQLLQAASVAAAKGAKFSRTTLCGEPIKVKGVITFYFVAPF